MRYSFSRSMRLFIYLSISPLIQQSYLFYFSLCFFSLSRTPTKATRERGTRTDPS